MSTNKEFSMHKGMSYKVTAKARGYYDYSTILNPDGTAITYDMTPYDGLKYNVDLTYNGLRTNTIDFSGTKLPYLGLANQTLQTTEYCLSSEMKSLLEYEKYYSNINVFGNIVIYNDVVSNFSSNNYITILTQLRSNKTITLKITTGDDISSSQNVISLQNYFDLQVYSNSFGCYDWGAATNYTLLSDITANTTYYWKIDLSTSNKTKTYSYSIDGTNYTEVKSFTDSGISYDKNYDACLGIHSSQKNQPFYGTIDLKESSISWESSDGITQIIYFLNGSSIEQKIDADYINNPEINFFGKTLNPLEKNTGNGYIKLHKFKMNPDNQAHIRISMNNKEVPSSSYITFFTIQQCCQVYAYNNKLIFNYKSTDNSWKSVDISSISSSSSYNFYLKFYDNNNIQIICKDGPTEIYNSILTDAVVSEENEYDCAIGATYEGTNNSYSYCSIMFLGLLSSIYKDYPGIYDSDYVDDGTAKTLNCFANGNENVILSEKENYEDYTWLGTVDIPTHIVK